MRSTTDLHAGPRDIAYRDKAVQTHQPCKAVAKIYLLQHKINSPIFTTLMMMITEKPVIFFYPLKTVTCPEQVGK